MDGQSCLCCSRPAAYEFKNLENGRQGVLCEDHGNALDVRDPQRFLRVRSATDENTARLKQEISDAYGRHQLSGHRIRIEPPPSLVNEQEAKQRVREHEALKWRHEAGIDRWDHPRDLPPPPPPEPPGVGD
jgi:hypothetical protein